MSTKPKLKTVESSEPTTAPLDPFDPETLRLDQSFDKTSGVRKLITTVPVRKPHAQDWIRVHSDRKYRLTVALIELKLTREQYLLTPDMARELEGEWKHSTIYTCINRGGVLFLWPIKVPDSRANEWHVSGHNAAEMGIKHWIRVKSDMDLGAYTIETTDNVIPEPTWPELSFSELLKIGFKNGRLVNNLEHPIVKHLRGL